MCTTGVHHTVAPPAGAHLHPCLQLRRVLRRHGASVLLGRQQQRLQAGGRVHPGEQKVRYHSSRATNGRRRPSWSRRASRRRRAAAPAGGGSLAPLAAMKRRHERVQSRCVVEYLWGRLKPR